MSHTFLHPSLVYFMCSLILNHVTDLTHTPEKINGDIDKLWRFDETQVELVKTKNTKIHEIL